jgi:uracil-DNA glycosylase
LRSEEEKYDDVLEILPTVDMIFNAFAHFNIAETKVVICGQDCYPTKGDAMGLAFSVPSGRRCAASLRNIFKEIELEYGIKRTQTNLTDWAKQGVLLLNSALTVREGCAGSHLKAWKPFTWDIIKYIGKELEHVVFILWGNHAQQYIQLIDQSKHLILKGIHPSPLAARSGNFVGNGHFKAANEYLEKFDKDVIKWI